MITRRSLAKCRLFSSLRRDDLQRLTARTADIRLNAGEWLAREGERIAFFVVLQGRLQVKKEVDGREMDITELGPGDFFGEVNALFGIPAVSSLYAKSVCRIAAFEPQQLQELIQSSTDCGSSILKELKSRLEDGPRHALQLASRRVRVDGPRTDPGLLKIAAFLRSNRIAYEWTEAGDGELSITIDDLPIPQPFNERHIANALGLGTKPQRSCYDVVIIGGGPSGLASAVYGASEGLRVLLVEQKAMGGQAGTSARIENYLGFPGGVSGDELTERAVRQAKRFGAELVLTRRVLSIGQTFAPAYRIVLDGYESVTTKAVIVATGVRWRGLPVDGLQPLLGRGVSYGVAGMEPARLSGKRVFLVGGGNSAGQAALSLANYAQTVTLLVRGAGLASSMSQYLIDQLSGKSNICVETETVLLDVHGSTALRTVRTSHRGMASDNRRADAVFIMIGADADTDWLPADLQRDGNGFICTGRDVVTPPGMRLPLALETSLPGVFCAGDVRHDSIKRVSSAVGEGSMAIAMVHQFLAREHDAPIYAPVFRCL